VSDRRRVVVIGVGQLRGNRDKDPARAREPLELVDGAVRAAASDAGVDAEGLAGVDTVGVVQIVSWAHRDAAADVATRIGATGAHTLVSGVGGHQPVHTLAVLADRIASGDAELALLCGGEAQASVDLLGATDDPTTAPGWSRDPGGPGTFSRETGGTERMWDLGLVGPVRIYPLWENRLRADLGQSFARSQEWSAQIYAGFTQVAAGNDAAWNPTPLTPEEIATVGPRNRMICFPYPLRMNALNKVDQAAAVLLASEDAADRLGVPQDRRVHLYAAAEDADCEDVLERPSYGGSAGLGRSLDRALEAAGTTAADLSVVDLYSCFPVVPKLAALHLGLAQDAQLSVTGGLTAFGGPHNDYSTHALVAAVRALRERGGTGLVYANGEYLTKHATVVLGTAPAPSPDFVRVQPSGTPDTVPVDDGWVGELTVETYTVEYDRAGSPARGYVIGATPAGDRCGVRVSRTDTATLDALVDPDAEPVGRTGLVHEVDGRRVFTLATP